MYLKNTFTLFLSTQEIWSTNHSNLCLKLTQKLCVALKESLRKAIRCTRGEIALRKVVIADSFSKGAPLLYFED